MTQAQPARESSTAQPDVRSVATKFEVIVTPVSDVDRSKSGPTVPPQGLCMVKVEHEEAWRVGKP